jgi:hypothetical protein
MSSSKMMFFTLLIFCWIMLNGFNAITVGVIHNASLTMLYSNITINASDCNKCLCVMLTSSMNLPIVSFNCFVNGTVGVNCQLFTNASYLGFDFSQIKINLNSTFYYRVLTLNNQSTTTLASVSTTAAITTEKSAYFFYIKDQFFVCILFVPKSNTEYAKSLVFHRKTYQLACSEIALL